MEPSLSEASALVASAERKPRRWGLTLAIRSSCRQASQLSGPGQPQGPGVQAPTCLEQERKSLLRGNDPPESSGGRGQAAGR